MTIDAKIVADSISPDGVRLTTMQLRYPKFIHGEFMTHRVFSRNASSSRAIPVKRLIADIVRDPVYPSYWGSNKPGMQAGEECIELVDVNGKWMRETAWDGLRNVAIEYAEAFAAAGYHKQIVNRILEPFCHINVVVTSTQWSNFYALRRHADAQPEIKQLADRMWEVQSLNSPKKLECGEWHLPYVHEEWGGFCDSGDTEEEAKLKVIKLSVARCARVSYLTHEGKAPDVEADLKLYDRLVGSHPIHASPAEHQATPDKLINAGSMIGDWECPNLHGNFRGWIQHRKTIDNECL